jgi:hypothetical protein
MKQTTAEIAKRLKREKKREKRERRRLEKRLRRRDSGHPLAATSVSIPHQ